MCISGLQSDWSLQTPNAIGMFRQGLYVNTESAFHVIRWDTKPHTRNKYSYQNQLCTSGPSSQVSSVDGLLASSRAAANTLPAWRDPGERVRTDRGPRSTGSALLRRVMGRVWKRFNALNRGDEFGPPEA
ncbi:hypothetical protein SARC_18212, partial [Sphaeroforma arctica JP610]